MLRLLDADPRSRMPGGASRRWVVVVSAVVMAGTALPMVMSSDTADPVDSPPPSPRPPQAPLPPPFPPPPLDQVIMTTGTASSELIDYTETKRYNISALIASDVAVDASLVTTEVQQGSVVLTSTIIVPQEIEATTVKSCLLYTSPSPRDLSTSRMPSSA